MKNPETADEEAEIEKLKKVTLFGKNPLDDGKTVQVLKEGNSTCLHPGILYLDVPLDGQAWICDSCGRHERIGYGNTPETYGRGKTMKFPANALISVPNPKFGGENFYSFRADADGVAQGLPLEKRVDRRTLDSKI